MEAHNRRPVARTGGVGRSSEELFEELAKAVAGLSPDRRQALTEQLEERMLADDLKTAILASGRTNYDIAKEAGIGPEILGRFVSGARDDIRLNTAGKIAAALGLRLSGELLDGSPAPEKPATKRPAPKKAPAKRKRKS